ncbi:MAG: 30S ribosomal protein S27ae [DPANN group archaeon]|nr:30S ribosomal protein S27ae [DPANN group archaeon]
MGKKPQKEKAPKPQIGKHYQEGKKKDSTCPKCGEGNFLAEHHDRLHCGKCGYTRWKK